MSTLAGRPRTALLVIDAQNGVLENGYERDGVLARIAQAVSKARVVGVPVIWVQHTEEPHLPHGTERWEFVPELSPAEDEPRIEKHWSDAFEATDLEATLAQRAVGHIVITGAETDQCIRGTLHGGLFRGYDVTLVSDAHTTSDNSEWGAPPPAAVIAHTNLYWTYEAAPGRNADTATADELEFRLPQPQ